MRCPECNLIVTHRHKRGGGECRAGRLRDGLAREGFITATHVGREAYDLFQDLKLVRREMTGWDAAERRIAVAEWIPAWAFAVYKRFAPLSPTPPARLEMIRYVIDRAKGRSETQRAVKAAFVAGADLDFLYTLVGGVPQ